MKKILLSTLLLIIGLTTYAAVWQSQGEAEITFEKTTHNFGSFPESSPKVTCVFKFKKFGRRSLGHSSSDRILRMYCSPIS